MPESSIKINIQLDSILFEQAKNYAISQGVSFSALVERGLKIICNKKKVGFGGYDLGVKGNLGRAEIYEDI